MTNNTVKNIKMPDGQVLEVGGGADTLPLFAGMYFDFKPNNFSWLKAGGQQNSGGIYTSCYNTLVSCLTAANNIYNIKVIEESEMIAGVDYSEYWKVNQTSMTFTTPLVTSLLSTIRNARILIDKKEPTETDTSWYNLYSDGWCEQGGFPYLAQNNTKITLPKSYIDNNYTLTFGSYDIDTNAQIQPLSYVTNTKTQNSFDVVSGYNNIFYVGNFGWQTAGYAEKPTAEEIVQSENVNLYFKVANAVENLELLDAGEVLETLADKISRQECKAYITETYQNGSSWYRVYSDGWIEQGGIIEEFEDKWTITFLKPFVSSTYILQGEQWGTDATGNLGILTQSTTNATGNHVGNGTIKVSWYACGY